MQLERSHIVLQFGQVPVSHLSQDDLTSIRLSADGKFDKLCRCQSQIIRNLTISCLTLQKLTRLFAIVCPGDILKNYYRYPLFTAQTLLRGLRAHEMSRLERDVVQGDAGVRVSFMHLHIRMLGRYQKITGREVRSQTVTLK